MDISRTESSSCFFFPHKSSSPIEIPGRQHHDSDPSSSTRDDRPTSPELIFEMEPFSPLDLAASPSTNYSRGLSAPSCTLDEREPLLYPFPVLSTTHRNSDRKRRTHPTPRSTPTSPPCIVRGRPAKPRRSSQPFQLPSPRQTPVHVDLDPAHAIRAVPIHKITGFKPDPAAQAPESRHGHGPIKKAPRKKPLAPPPRSARSFSSSPWRLGDASDDEPRSFEVDFTQHLLRRIDSQKPLQFQAFQAMMSVSVR